MTSTEVFPGTWQRALLPLLLLDELSRGATHGYALSKSLSERGFDPIKGATLYPALAKLEATELVSTSWEDGQGGPGRKVYELTAAGREELVSLRERFSQLSTMVLGIGR